MISVEVWNKQKLWNDFLYDPNADDNAEDGVRHLMDTFQDALEALVETGEAGESFTVVVRNLSGPVVDTAES